MPRRLPVLCTVAAFAATGLALWPAFGEAPAKVSEVAPVEDLAREAEAQVATAEQLVAGEFSELKIGQAGGVLALLGQAIAEHPDKSKVKISGPDLRDAAMALSKTKSAGDAKAALGRVKEALAGKGGAASTEAQWNKLANLHRLMEEVNFRNSRLRRIVRRPGKDPVEDSLHATTLAVIALAVEADTHEVKNPDDLPKWREYTRGFRTNMTAMATALKAKDAAAAKDAFTKANQSCNDCHAHFRIETKE